MMIIYEDITGDITDIKDRLIEQERLLYEVLEALKQKEEDDELGSSYSSEEEEKKINKYEQQRISIKGKGMIIRV